MKMPLTNDVYKALWLATDDAIETRTDCIVMFATLLAIGSGVAFDIESGLHGEIK